MLLRVMSSGTVIAVTPLSGKLTTKRQLVVEILEVSSRWKYPFKITDMLVLKSETKTHIKVTASYIIIAM